MGGLTSTAKTRLAFIEFNNQVQDVSLTCRVFKISRETFYKWKGRFNPHDLSSLEDKSKAPLNKRKDPLSFEERQKLKRYRLLYIRTGKLKLSTMYEKEYQKKVSSWQFQKVIEDYGLYYDKIKARKIKIKKDKVERRRSGSIPSIQ